MKTVSRWWAISLQPLDSMKPRSRTTLNTRARKRKPRAVSAFDLLMRSQKETPDPSGAQSGEDVISGRSNMNPEILHALETAERAVLCLNTVETDMVRLRSYAAAVLEEAATAVVYRYPELVSPPGV